MGAPSTYTVEVADKICQQLIDGYSLRSICAVEGMPDISSIFRWLEAHEYFREHYTRARSIQADVAFDEIQDISDDVRSPEEAQVARLRIDTRKWRMSKMLPKKYGDKLEQTLQNPDGTPLKVIHMAIAGDVPTDPETAGS